MTENAEWDKAITYEKFLKNARENIELMKARYNDLQLNETDLDTLKGIQNNIKILVIGTERCNDTAGNLPILAKMVDTSTKLQLRILDADANVEFHQHYKVNGKRKTPVLLFLNQDYEELCRWVERPNAAYKLINEGTIQSVEDRKAELKKLYSDPEIQRQSLNEFLRLILRADFILGRK
ncbi:MAG: thioredoxin family protein [Candidatus Thorarchaeota archaeon]|nr:thioredoxin family protein [Candidatus Thorarchaeota archaeon]